MQSNYDEPSTADSYNRHREVLRIFEVRREEYAQTLRDKAAYQRRRADELVPKLERAKARAKLDELELDSNIGKSTAYQLSTREDIERSIKQHESWERACLFAVEHLSFDKVLLTQTELAGMLDETRPIW